MNPAAMLVRTRVHMNDDKESAMLCRDCVLVRAVTREMSFGFISNVYIVVHILQRDLRE